MWQVASFVSYSGCVGAVLLLAIVAQPAVRSRVNRLPRQS
jgi:hypothetical protein